MYVESIKKGGTQHNHCFASEDEGCIYIMTFLKSIRLDYSNWFYIQNFSSENSNSWKNVSYVISKIKSITGLNLKFIKTGFFVVKNVGILFQNKINIYMAELESQNKKILNKFINPFYVLKIIVP